MSLDNKIVPVFQNKNHENMFKEFINIIKKWNNNNKNVCFITSFLFFNIAKSIELPYYC